jgi:thiosulfate/3-mercaptopyruvate sulfurtransferase
VPAAHLLDPKTNEFLPADEPRERFDAIGAFRQKRHHLLRRRHCRERRCPRSGHARTSRCRLYDASLSEWATDPSLPMETG